MPKNKTIKKQDDGRSYKIVLIIIYYILICVIPLSGILIQRARALFLIEGIFLIVYAILGIVLKIPLFNRHYSFNSYGFDNRFGFRHYFAFAIMIFGGAILFTISFGM